MSNYNLIGSEVADVAGPLLSCYFSISKVFPNFISTIDVKESMVEKVYLRGSWVSDCGKCKETARTREK